MMSSTHCQISGIIYITWSWHTLTKYRLAYIGILQRLSGSLAPFTVLNTYYRELGRIQDPWQLAQPPRISLSVGRQIQ